MHFAFPLNGINALLIKKVMGQVMAILLSGVLQWMLRCALSVICSFWFSKLYHLDDWSDLCFFIFCLIGCIGASFSKD